VKPLPESLDSNIADIAAVARYNPDLDRERLRWWIAQVGELLEEPDLWNRIEPLLNPD
jgi:hypothetical protein